MRPEVAAGPVQVHEGQSSSQVSSINIGKTSPPPEPIGQRSQIKLLLGVVAAGLALALVLALLIGLGLRKKASAEGPADPVIGVAPLPPTPTVDEPREVALPPLAPAPALESSAAAPASSASAKPRIIKKTSRPGCNPPYTLDKHGTRIPKLECY